MAKHKIPFSRRLWQVMRILMLAVAVAVAGYWSGLRPVPVTIHPVHRGEIGAEIMGTGTLEARVRATVSPKISGLITKVGVDQGDRITTGQALVHLDDSDLNRQVQIAQADLATAKAGLDRLRADRARALAVLDQARREHQRL